MKHPIHTQGYGLLGLLLTVLIIGILMGTLLPQIKNSMEKASPSHPGVNVEQIKKELNDTMKKHETDLANYEKALQGNS